MEQWNERLHGAPIEISLFLGAYLGYIIHGYFYYPIIITYILHPLFIIMIMAGHVVNFFLK